MAIAVSLVKVYVVGDRKEVIADVTFDNSYPTGGEPLTGADLGLDIELNFIDGNFAKNVAGTSAIGINYDDANSKLRAFRYDGASAGKAFLEEVSNAVDLSTFTARIRAVGKGKAAA